MARLIAIDWDQNQVYVVAATVSGGAVHVQRALTWTEEQPPSLSRAEAIGLRLKQHLKEAGIAAAPLLGCVPRDKVIVKEVRYPNVPDVEEPAVIRFQTIKELTDSPDDVIIDYVARGMANETEKRASALVIRKELLETYQKVAQAAGLKLSGLAPRLVGAVTCLRRVMGTTVVTPMPEPDTGVIAVAVVGEKQAEVGVIKGDHFLLARSVAAGPNLAAEVRRNLAVHAGQSPDQPVGAVYVGGKGSGELRERLKELVDVPVHTFDPFAGSEAGQLPPGNRGLFAGPMGLLYQRAGGELPVNFVSPRQPRPPADPNYRRMRVLALAVVALLVGLFVAGQVMIAAEESYIGTTKASAEDLAGKLAGAKENVKKLKAINDWDNPPWIDELWEMAARSDLKQVRFLSFRCDSVDRSSQSKYIGQMTLQGTALADSASSRRRAYDQLVTQFTREGYYSINSQASRFEDPAFTLVVRVVRRSPAEYTTTIEDPTIVKDKSKTKSSRR